MSELRSRFRAAHGLFASPKSALSKIAGIVLVGVMASTALAEDFKTPPARKIANDVAATKRVPTAEAAAQASEVSDNALQFELQHSRTVRLSGDINTEMATRVITQLKMLDKIDPKHKDIELRIQSPGGEVDAGMAIYDAIQSLQSDVRTVCEGSCSSMAAFLLAAGAPGKRSAEPNTTIMIHQPSGGVTGQTTDMQIAAKMMQRVKDRMSELMSRHTGMDINDLRKMLERDYYLSATEARNLGIIDKIETPRKTLPAMGKRRVMSSDYAP